MTDDSGTITVCSLVLIALGLLTILEFVDDLIGEETAPVHLLSVQRAFLVLVQIRRFPRSYSSWTSLTNTASSVLFVAVENI